MISVIIPTYNEEKVIGQLLTSLISIPSLEIIVSDGGSQDATRSICEGLAVKFISSSLGRGAQQNAGASMAAGDILYFLHADSILENRVIDEIRQAVEQGGAWGCCTLAFNAKGLFFKYLAWISNLRAKYLSVCFGDQGIFCTTELFLAVGGFPSYPIMEDLNLSKQLRKVSRAKVIHAKIVTSARRFTQGGSWRTLLRMQVLQLLFHLGTNLDKLASMYRRGFK
ncbi:MAG: TIGR04283 family arsenosugar biosynthesis glycosyltransferase [Desulfitobacteriaceae bacterium]